MVCIFSMHFLQYLDFSFLYFQPLKVELVNSCNEYENLNSERLKLSLIWPGCNCENIDESLKLNCSFKLKVIFILCILNKISFSSLFIDVYTLFVVIGYYYYFITNNLFLFKFQAFRLYGKALSIEKNISNYHFSTESLEKLCNILENFFQLNQSISDASELNNISLTVKVCNLFFTMVFF